MPRYRLSRLAEADLAGLLATSRRERGAEGRRRYAAVIAAAMRKLAADPEAPPTHDRAELAPGVRSLHLRHVGSVDERDRVRRPVHVLYYRPVMPRLIEIVRVLHERMEPSRHLHEVSADRHGYE